MSEAPTEEEWLAWKEFCQQRVGGNAAHESIHEMAADGQVTSIRWDEWIGHRRNNRAPFAVLAPTDTPSPKP